MKIGIPGAAGRMGQALTRQVTATDGCTVVAATEVPEHAALGRDCGALAGIEPLGVAISDDPQAMFRAADAVLDFTLPGAANLHAELAAAEGTMLVIGTTGLGADEQAALEAAAARVAVVQAPNMSLAVNLLFRLTEQVAGILDDDYDIEIVEMHHRHKIDAPSGTALGLGRAAARARGVAFDEVAARGRDGVTGARPRGEIGFAALRGGDVIGEHSVIFAADGERLELA
ncbi:MAG: 4-hydroxy-tetrahydrodipicolinate reductase, partial [Rhodospirillaceae bacterium]|nr:4-hydroxy-tetrahydrodipicolinate reductase [Rhodospirillaceae bacterium]